MLGLNRTQLLVLFAAWLGWGFDVFDGLLFNFVAPNCVPALLKLTAGTPEAKAATMFWTGTLTSLMLLGWAAGGIIFGKVADKIGRSKTMILTILLYALGTGACALAPNIWVLMIFRTIAALGIGGEWATGASLVAETVPEKHRVIAGALLYTAAPVGLILATFLNYQIAGVWLAESPETSWRVVFALGLIPAFIALLMRFFVPEPDAWKEESAKAPAPKIRELFTPEFRNLTISGVLMALIAVITWWSCNAFLPVVSAALARDFAAASTFPVEFNLQNFIEGWKARASMAFNIGGLIGTLATVPIAHRFGRRVMFRMYFAFAALALFGAFGLDISPDIRLWGYFLLGLSVFGIFGSFTFYLPELFPTRLRATGSGFCYNIGRVLAAAGPYFVGFIASKGDLNLTMQVLFWLGIVPLIGAILSATKWVVETRK